MKSFKDYVKASAAMAQHRNHPKGFYDIVHGKHTSEMTPTQKREYRARRRRDIYHKFKSKYNPWESSSAVARDRDRV